MNRKATGIILSIAALAMTVGIFCRPSVQPMSPERHAVRTPAAALSAPEYSRVGGTSAELQALPTGSPEALTVKAPALTVPAIEVAPRAIETDPRYHPGDRAPAEKIVARYGDADLTADHPEVAAAIKIQERHPELMAHRAVVGTAVGLNDEGQIALIVYTKGDAPEIPGVVEGLPVAVWRSGELFARRQDGVARKGPGTTVTTSSFDPTIGHRPIPIGVSTGHPLITAGTLGCRVTDGTNVFALSNNHVFANENSALIGDNALQPGTFDGGAAPADAFGKLYDFETIVFTQSASNMIDAALVKPTTDNLLLNYTAPDAGSYGTPKSSTASAALRMAVQKYGRTTHHTQGKVQGLNAAVVIDYGPAGVARFVSQIIINPGGFSAGGDSGSLIVVRGGASDRKPVGLLFAGSSSITIANPIGPVLSRFGVAVDGN